MFLEIEVTRALTSLELLLATLIGLAPIGLTLWVKLVLYRRRMAEDNEEASRLQNAIANANCENGPNGADAQMNG